MFERAKKEISDNEIASPEQNPGDRKPAKEVKFTVHTMPKKFHAAHGGSSTGSFEKPANKNSSSSKIVIFSVVGVVVIGLGVIGFLLFKKNASTADNVANGNSNVNTNVNTDVTLNFNKNSNSNSNANTNSNSNSNTNAATNTNANSNTNSTNRVSLSQAPSSQDLDGDSLTDVEEVDYGTEKTKADSDNDSFADGVEISFGYSPLDKGKLDSAANIGIYTNPTYGFSFLYPDSWVVDKRGTDGKGVLLISPGGEEYIEVSIQDNFGRKTPQEWYLELAPANTSASSLLTALNWAKTTTGVISVDGYSTFFGSGNYIFTMYYATGTHTSLDYKATYNMIVKSVAFTTPTVVNTNTSTNTNSNTNTSTNTNTNSNSNNNTNDLFNVNMSSNTNTNTNTNSNSNTNTN